LSDDEGVAPGGSDASAAASSRPIRVLIVEDHRILAEGLELTLQRHGDLTVVGLAGSVAEASQIALRERPDVILMDFHLPDGTGAQAAATIREQLPDVAVVILSGDTSEAALIAAVEAGASGFLSKSQATVQVTEAVRRAADGEMLIPAATLAGLVARQRQRALVESERARLLVLLTPRETEILRLMAQGFDNRAIADQLVISFTTVRGHVQNLLTKLGAHSKLEAVARAGQLGLLDPS
jgi:DNA-binding NarL/FixJ family response regulator